MECTHVSVGGCRVQERMVDPLKLELWVFVNLLMWVPGAKPGSPAWTVGLLWGV